MAPVVRLRDLCAGAPQILDWLNEHGLSPDEVALDEEAGPFIDGDQMTVHLFKLDQQGHRYVDPTKRAAATEVRVVTLLRPPPDLYRIDGAPFPATVPA